MLTLWWAELGPRVSGCSALGFRSGCQPEGGWDQCWGLPMVGEAGFRANVGLLVCGPGSDG